MLQARLSGRGETCVQQGWRQPKGSVWSQAHAALFFHQSVCKQQGSIWKLKVIALCRHAFQSQIHWHPGSPTGLPCPQIHVALKILVGKTAVADFVAAVSVDLNSVKFSYSSLFCKDQIWEAKLVFLVALPQTFGDISGFWQMFPWWCSISLSNKLGF